MRTDDFTTALDLLRDVPFQFMDSMRSCWFAWLLAYFTAIQYFLPLDGRPVPQFSPLYFLLVAPIWCIILLNFRRLFSKSGGSSLSIWLFLLGTLLVSLPRGDYSTVYTVAVFALLVIAIIKFGAHAPLKVLNVIFIAAAAGSIISYYAGNNPFGFLPGQSSTYKEAGLEWRISLFPLLPESAFFSLFVLTANLFMGAGRKKWIFVALAGYFLAFSGIRTAIIAALFAIALRVFNFWSTDRKRGALWAAWVGALSLFFIASSSDILFRIVPDLGIDALNQYVYRNQAGLASAADLQTTVHRGVVWKLHADAFAAAFPWGCGTIGGNSFDAPHCGAIFESIDPNLCLACSAFTSWLSRVGIMALPLLFFFVVLLPKKAITEANPFLLASCFAIVAIACAWGVVFNSYNLVFLAYVSAMNMKPSIAGDNAL